MTESPALFIKAVGDSSHPPILFIHGFMGSHHDWDQDIDTLSSQYYCLAIDLPGHGQSPAMPTLSLNNLSQLIVESIIKPLQTPIILAGYSLGGRVALSIASQYPNLIKECVIESAHPGLDTSQEKTLRLTLDQRRSEQLRSGSFKDFLMDWIQMPLFGELSAHPDIDRWYNQRLTQNQSFIADAMMQFSLGYQESTWQWVAENSELIIYIYGELDQKYAALASRLTSLGVTTIQCDGCGHNVRFESPETLQKHLWIT